MSISEALAQAAITKEKIRCPRRGAHGPRCACKGTRWVTACTGCKGTGWNAKMQKVCGACQGLGCVMALRPETGK